MFNIKLLSNHSDCITQRLLQNIACKKEKFKKFICKREMASNINTESFERRVFAISDLHVDYEENKNLLVKWFRQNKSYQKDCLILAGDVSHSLNLLREALTLLTSTFGYVVFVPGNHDLWVKTRDSGADKDSIKKFNRILDLCTELNVHTKPLLLESTKPVWIVPLFSWYNTNDDDAANSLYRKTTLVEENLERDKQIWADEFNCSWPKMTESIASYFSKLNAENIESLSSSDVPAISCSHFLPRNELIYQNDEEFKNLNEERNRLGLSPLIHPRYQGGKVIFNFSRVAGSLIIEKEIRKLGSVIHVYGHQHRNRDRIIDNVRYVSHCLGYPRERAQGLIWGISQWNGPKQIWP